ELTNELTVDIQSLGQVDEGLHRRLDVTRLGSRVNVLACGLGFSSSDKSFEGLRLIALVQLSGSIEGLLQTLAVVVQHLLRLVRRHLATAQQRFGIELTNRPLVLNLLIQKRLG